MACYGGVVCDAAESDGLAISTSIQLGAQKLEQRQTVKQ